MRLCGVQKGCVKIAELFVSILFAPVAQRIERRFPKPCVGGSSPLGGASVFGSTFGGPVQECFLGFFEFREVPVVVVRCRICFASVYSVSSMTFWKVENKKSA